MARKSVTSARRKPSKPRRDFPLFAHRNGQWAYRYPGDTNHTFCGVWDDPQAAEAFHKLNREYRDQGYSREEARELSRNPDASQRDGSIGCAINLFMDHQAAKRDRGELAPRTVTDYHQACKRIASHFGKSRKLDSLRSIDFEKYRSSLPGTWSPTTVNNHLRHAKIFFKYCNDAELCDRMIRYSIGLKAVSKTVVKKHKAKQPKKDFSAEECWRLLDAAGTPMRAFILLGLNCAYGPADIGRLKISMIDFDNQWLGEVRGKTGEARGAWLWSETIEAIREGIETRPYTGNERLDAYAFLTKCGNVWWDEDDEKNDGNPVSSEFLKLKSEAGVKKPYVGQYSMRHVFETVSGDLRDQQATNYVMGHDDPSMAAVYREGIDPARVKAVCQHVRKWLMDGKPKGGAK